MEFETERLLIREFKPSDQDSVYEYMSNPEVAKYMRFEPHTPDHSKNYIEQAISKQNKENRTDFKLAIVHIKENKVIGGCRINKETDIQAHIGYLLNQKYWGYGYATEVAKALVTVGFSELDVHRIYALCVPDNVGSWRVLEKVGLVREGRLRESILSQGKYCDAFMYGILQHEWETNTP